MILEFIIRIIADAAVIPIALIGAWALLYKVPKERRFATYARVLMAGLTAYMLAKFAATIYQPSDLRPFQQLGIEPGAFYLDNPGFPSDHALFVTAILCAVWFETRLKKVSSILLVLVILVCVGRVLANVHTPLDVIAGVLIALVGSLWYSTVPRRTLGIQKEHGHGKNHSKPATYSR